MRRIKVLGEDISSAGIHLDPPRRLLYIESIFISGDRNIALREWKAAEHLQKDQTYFQNHCELGVRMYSQVGNVNQALRVAERCLQNSQDPSHFRILLPIIQASLNSKEGYPVQLAWALYIRMRSHLGAQMMMEDYDTVTSMFLIANQPDLALGAFTDMMLTGSSSAVEQDSTAQYRKAAGVKHLNSIAVQNRELKWENSRVFTKLPARFNNRFFFGSWLKKLIGEGKLDAAKQVFDHMQARRIKPDSKHMNGLIGAWLRQGTEGTRILAEDMAWTMIQSRIDFVKSREAAYNLIAPLQVIETYDRRSSKSLTLIPSATSETFAILIEQYRRRQKPELVVDLCKALRNARIRPSTYFMNELLLCDSRAHRLGWVWDTYYSLSKETGVRPDFDTYEILWTLIKKVSAHTHAASKQSTSFPPCRRLFADMVERGSKDDLPREIYNLVILSFSLTLDQAGTAVALRALQRNFGMYPDEETAHIIVKQLARLGLTNELGDTPRRLNLRSSETRKRIHNVTRILEKFRVQRVEVLAEQGIVFDELKGDAKAEEFLLLLSDLLRYVAQARIAAEQRHNFNAAIASKTAAEQMGVPDCVPWLAHEKGEVEIV
jgi:pentatricopeptide repeat protein